MVACFKLLLPAVALLATLGEKEEEGKEEEEKEGDPYRREQIRELPYNKRLRRQLSRFLQLLVRLLVKTNCIGDK